MPSSTIAPAVVVTPPAPAVRVQADVRIPLPSVRVDIGIGGGVMVREGESVQARQVIGRVGGQQTPEGPHIEFQVRAPVSGGLPQPVDPLTWLRGRAGR